MKNKIKTATPKPEVPSQSIEPMQEKLQKQKGHFGLVKKLLAYTLALILLLSIGVVYRWQHQKVIATQKALDSSSKEALKQNSKVSELNKDVTNLNTQISTLEGNNKKLTSSLQKYTKAPVVVQAPTQADLPLTVVGAARFNLHGSWNTSYDGVAIEISLTNPTTSPVSITPTGFILKDSQNNAFQQAPDYSSGNLPTGYVVLTPQTLQPGETVQGEISFQNDQLGLNTFTLLYGTNTYPIESTPSP
jgi:cell division protein FtsL